MSHIKRYSYPKRFGGIPLHGQKKKGKKPTDTFSGRANTVPPWGVADAQTFATQLCTYHGDSL